MKYHVTLDGKTAACGAIKVLPDTFVFDRKGFENHYAKAYACKRCKRILKNLDKRRK